MLAPGKREASGCRSFAANAAPPQAGAAGQLSTKVNASPRLGSVRRTEMLQDNSGVPCAGQCSSRLHSPSMRRGRTLQDFSEANAAGQTSARLCSSPRPGCLRRSQSLQQARSETPSAGQQNCKLNTTPRIGSAHRGQSLHERSEMSLVEEERAFQQTMQRRSRGSSPRLAQGDRLSLNRAQSADSQPAAGGFNQYTPRCRQMPPQIRDVGRAVAKRIAELEQDMPVVSEPLGAIKGEGQFKKGYSAESEKNITKWHPRLFRYETVNIEPVQSRLTSRRGNSVSGDAGTRAGKCQSSLNSARLHAWELGPVHGPSPRNVRNSSSGVADATNHKGTLERAVAERSERLKEDTKFRDLCLHADCSSRLMKNARDTHRAKYGMGNSESVGGSFQGPQ